MNNDAKIYINVEELVSKIEILKQEKQKMETVFSRMKNNFNNMVNYWSGDSGEKIYSYLNDYSNDFPIIIKRIDNDIIFLEKVVDAHRKMESAITNKIEENSNIKI